MGPGGPQSPDAASASQPPPPSSAPEQHIKRGTTGMGDEESHADLNPSVRSVVEELGKKIKRSFAPRGNMQLFEMEDFVTFTCSNRNTSITSRKLAIDSNNNLLSNSAYGILLAEQSGKPIVGAPVASHSHSYAPYSGRGATRGAFASGRARGYGRGYAPGRSAYAGRGQDRVWTRDTSTAAAAAETGSSSIAPAMDGAN